MGLIGSHHHYGSDEILPMLLFMTSSGVDYSETSGEEYEVQ